MGSLEFWKHCDITLSYKGRPKSSYVDVMSTKDEFIDPWDSMDGRIVLTARGQSWKINLFGHFFWEYLGQPMNFSANTRRYNRGRQKTIFIQSAKKPF